MEPAYLKPYESLLRGFGADLESVIQNVDKYHQLREQVRPPGGLIKTCGLYQEIDGRFKMFTTIKIEAMATCIEKIKSSMTSRSLGKMLLSILVSSPEDALITHIQQMIDKIKKIHDEFVEDLKTKLIYFAGDLIYDEASHFATASMKGFPDLSECHCCNQMTRNNGRLREKFSISIVETLAKLKPLNEPEQQITLCSVGSGGCYHELEIHARLLSTLVTHSNCDVSQSRTKLQKYKIKWVLIDLKYKQSHNAPKMFELLATTMHAATEVETLQSMDDYLKKGDTIPDAMIAIDFEDGKGSINPQPLLDKQKELIAKGHRCAVAVLDKWRGRENKQVDISLPEQITP